MSPTKPPGLFEQTWLSRWYISRNLVVVRDFNAKALQREEASLTLKEGELWIWSPVLISSVWIFLKFLRSYYTVENLWQNFPKYLSPSGRAERISVLNVHGVKKDCRLLQEEPAVQMPSTKKYFSYWLLFLRFWFQFYTKKFIITYSNKTYISADQWKGSTSNSSVNISNEFIR